MKNNIEYFNIYSAYKINEFVLTMYDTRIHELFTLKYDETIMYYIIQNQDWFIDKILRRVADIFLCLACII